MPSCMTLRTIQRSLPSHPPLPARVLNRSTVRAAGAAAIRPSSFPTTPGQPPGVGRRVHASWRPRRSFHVAHPRRAAGRPRPVAAAISTETYHELADEFIEDLVERLEDLQEAREDVDVEYSVSLRAPPFLIGSPRWASSGFPPRARAVRHAIQPPAAVWRSADLKGGGVALFAYSLAS
jgi:hypothetical protein